MRTRLFLKPIKGRHLSLILLASLAFTSTAQITTIPVVTIKATDPFASWSGDTGTFTLFRDGPTSATLNIFYRVGGTASNRVDYAAIGHWVTVPAGERTNSILISTNNKRQRRTR